MTEVWSKVLHTLAEKQFEHKGDQRNRIEKQCEHKYESGQHGYYAKYAMERSARPMQEEITNLKNQLAQVEEQRNHFEAENTQIRTDNDALLNSNNNLENAIQTIRQTEDLLTEENKQLKEKELSLENEVLHLKSRVEKDQMAQNNTILENDLRMMATEATAQFNVLSEKVAHFAEELLEKRDDLPTLGQNNTEELEVQKFVDFVVDSTIQLKELAPNGLNMPSSSRITTRNCMLCHEQPQFAKCYTENCGSTYHKECIQKWFKTRRNCPCCQNDSVRFEEENADE